MSLDHLKPPGDDRSRSPSRSPRDADKVPLESMDSTLDVAKYMISCKTRCWETQALDIFRAAGFVVISEVLSEHQCQEVLSACEEVAAQIVGPEQWGNRSNRGRYSFGVASSTGSILHVPEIAGNLLVQAGLVLHPLLEEIFSKDGKADFLCYSGGGDFVLPGVKDYQFLHGDMPMAPGDDRMPPPFLSVNFCVQPLTALNGPIRLVPGKTERDWDRRKEEPPEWRSSRLFPCPAGAALLRDVRILHAGTPNWSAATRFLPSIEYISGGLRATQDEAMFPPSRCIPRGLYETLPEPIQILCRELVAEQGSEPENEDSENLKPWQSRYWHGVTYERA